MVDISNSRYWRIWDLLLDLAQRILLPVLVVVALVIGALGTATFIAAWVVCAAVVAYPLTILWNANMPYLFGLPVIDYWRALLLLVGVGCFWFPSLIMRVMMYSFREMWKVYKE